MPTTDPTTTDRLAAAIRTGMATQPLLTTHARPVADRLTMLIRKRLPNITAADTGELMIHLSAYLSAEIAALSEQGETPNSAILVATSATAVAGVELYGNGEQPPTAPSTDAPDEAPYAAEQDGDVRAVAALAAANDDAELDRAVSDLIARFADRIEALEAREAQ